MYSSLHLRQFRSYADYTVDFSPGVTIVVGPNGSGKTNLLEALYVLSVGSSFRATDRDLVQHGTDGFKIEGLWTDQKRTLTYRLRAEAKAEKQYDFDGVKKARLTHNFTVPVVLFEPDHLRLLKGSPSARRDYLDGFLAKLQPDFTWLRHQYERVLQQRNAVLKRRLAPGPREDQLFAWDIRLAELAWSITERRLALVAMLSVRLAGTYSAIAQKTTQASLHYVSQVDAGNYKAALLQLLNQNIQRDVERGFTSAGPHRDDFEIVLAKNKAASTASRGEVRSLLLALKLLELELLAEKTNKAPLLLLDDVFSELDATRRQALALRANVFQTVITTTDHDNLEQLFLKSFRVIKTQRAGY